MYALGLIALELVLRGEAPSQAWGVREDQLRRAVALVPEVGALLRGCLEHEPAQRWTATAALEFAQGAAAAPPPPPFPAALPPAQARQDAISLGLQMEVETQRQRAELAELRAQEQSERATRACEKVERIEGFAAEEIKKLRADIAAMEGARTELQQALDLERAKNMPRGVLSELPAPPTSEVSRLSTIYLLLLVRNCSIRAVNI